MASQVQQHWCVCVCVTFVLQAALPVGLALGLAVALQALVLQQGLLPLQLPQAGLQVLPAAHLPRTIETAGESGTFYGHVLAVA